jgi:hypothetical protein
MSTEDFEFMRKERTRRKAEKRAFNTEYVRLLTGIMEMEVDEITPYQLRITADKRRLDYFPTSGKGTWVGSGKYFKISNIESFLKKNFKSL